MLKKTLSLHRIGAANFSQVVDNAKHMETAATGTVPYRGPRLLLCDDSPVERMALGHYLRRAGYDVRLIENPDAREWRTLAEKLGWGVSPSYQK